MPDSFTRLQLDPPLVRARHVGYSVRMVAEIAAHYDEPMDSSEFRTARCMADAFYVHVRLLAEFLVRTPKGGDFAPADFGIAWEAPGGAATARLGEGWDVASKYVVHFGGRRVPKCPDDASEFTVGGPCFRQLAGDALEVYSVFVDAVAAVTPDWTNGGGALIPDPVPDPDGWRARTRSDALRELRSARDEARKELGP